jgi:hypothetical protein
MWAGDILRVAVAHDGIPLQSRRCWIVVRIVAVVPGHDATCGRAAEGLRSE